MKCVILACLIALAVAQHHPHPSGHIACTSNAQCHGCTFGHGVCHEGFCHCFSPIGRRLVQSCGVDAQCAGYHCPHGSYPHCEHHTQCGCKAIHHRRQTHITCASDSECTSLTCTHGAYCHKEHGHQHQTHGHCQCHNDNFCSTDTDCANWHHCANPFCDHNHGHGHAGGHCHCH